jgi:hypothetical protein
VEARTLDCHQRNNPHTFKEDVPMAQRKFVVLVDWIDGDIEDSDEIVVFADNAERAILSAKRKWKISIGVEWPHCRIVELKILTPSRLLGLA